MLSYTFNTFYFDLVIVLGINSWIIKNEAFCLTSITSNVYKAFIIAWILSMNTLKTLTSLDLIFTLTFT